MVQRVQLGDALDLVAAAVTLGLIVLVNTGHVGAPRMLLAVGFAFFVPGRAIVSNWRQVAGWSEAAVAMVISVGVLTIAATATLWVHLWRPLMLFQVVAGLSLVGLATGLARRHSFWRADAVRPADSDPQAGASSAGGDS